MQATHANASKRGQTQTNAYTPLYCSCVVRARLLARCPRTCPSTVLLPTKLERQTRETQNEQYSDTPLYFAVSYTPFAFQFLFFCFPCFFCCVFLAFCVFFFPLLFQEFLRSRQQEKSLLFSGRPCFFQFVPTKNKD